MEKSLWTTGHPMCLSWVGLGTKVEIHLVHLDLCSYTSRVRPVGDSVGADQQLLCALMRMALSSDLLPVFPIRLPQPPLLPPTWPGSAWEFLSLQWSTYPLTDGYWRPKCPWVEMRLTLRYSLYSRAPHRIGLRDWIFTWNHIPAWLPPLFSPYSLTGFSWVHFLSNTSVLWNLGWEPDSGRTGTKTSLFLGEHEPKGALPKSGSLPLWATVYSLSSEVSILNAYSPWLETSSLNIERGPQGVSVMDGWVW